VLDGITEEDHRELTIGDSLSRAAPHARRDYAVGNIREGDQARKRAETERDYPRRQERKQTSVVRSEGKSAVE
jgi:hypothetical protein